MFSTSKQASTCSSEASSRLGIRSSSELRLEKNAEPQTLPAKFSKDPANVLRAIVPTEGLPALWAVVGVPPPNDLLHLC